MSGIQGLSFSGKLSETVKKLREAYKYVTVIPVGSGRNAMDTVSRGYYSVANAEVVEAGSDANLLKKTAHTFKKGDLIRLQTTANSVEEFEVFVDEIIDADYVRLSAILSANLTAGDTYDHLRPISERFDSTGTTLATITPFPMSYDLDGSVVNVKKDTVTPANTRAVPVEIHGASGVTFNINAGDLGVQLNHTGANSDSVRVGDGTNLLGINANNEAKTHDADALTKLTEIDNVLDTIDVDTGNISTDIGLLKQALASLAGDSLRTSVISSVLPTGAATETTLNSILGRLWASLGQANMANSAPVTIASDQSAIPVSQSGTWNINNVSGTISLPTGAANQTKQDSQITEAQSTNTKLDSVNTVLGTVAQSSETNPANSGSILQFIKGVVSKLIDVSAQLPVSLGAKLSNSSLSVVPATDAVFSTAPAALVGSFAEINNLTNAVQTFTMPVGAKWFKIMADGDNPSSVRMKIGATPTASSGMKLEAGRSEDFQAVGNVNVIAEVAGTNYVSIHWGV